jgi:molybdopterin molybdotransferase
VLRVEEAQVRVLSELQPLGPETVPLDLALGRTLAVDIVSTRTLPPWDASTMDGFAVHSADCARAGAATEAVADLPIVATVRAGDPPPPPLPRGRAVRIMTGAPLPAGADAVVMREHADAAGDRVQLRHVPAPRENVRHAGDDIRAGETALAAGTPLGPGEIGLLAGLGRALVAVHRQPTVAIVSTGDELCEIDQPLGPGQIANSNAHALAAQVRRAGGIPIICPIAKDDPGSLRTSFAAAARADVLVSSGGVSVGEFDYVKEALASAGFALDFWRVAMQPGKPIAFGLASGGVRPGFGLPGNPASSMVSFELFVAPALRKLGGARNGWFAPRAVVTLEGGHRKEAGRRFYLRAHVWQQDGELRARANPRQASGLLRSMVDVNALVELAEETTITEPGARVPALLLDVVKETP